LGDGGSRKEKRCRLQLQACRLCHTEMKRCRARVRLCCDWERLPRTSWNGAEHVAAGARLRRSAGRPFRRGLVGLAADLDGITRPADRPVVASPTSLEFGRRVRCLISLDARDLCYGVSPSRAARARPGAGGNARRPLLARGGNFRPRATYWAGGRGVRVGVALLDEPSCASHCDSPCHQRVRLWKLQGSTHVL